MKINYQLGGVLILFFSIPLFSVPSFGEIFSRFTLPSFSEGNPVVQSVHREIIDSFGNKTFNLCVLSALAQSINNELLKESPNQCAVPKFMAISSQEIASFLNSKFQLEAVWQEFKRAQGSSKELTQKAIQVLMQIRASIAQAFSSLVIPETMRNEIAQFIQKENAQYMVRSTGYEDRTDIANAGGNESVAAVPDNVEAIWRAMSIVVQSYFSEKSIKQRLLAGDDVTKNYFIPVLIQQMVGERLWNGSGPSIDTIPVSGVMFSKESSGDTSGVVHIQTAFGHNQGVVNSLVAVDSFYIGLSGLIHPTIRKKMNRYVAVKKGNVIDLDRIPNPRELQSRPTLSSAIVHDLDKIGRKIQKLYQHAMDIEFVVQKKARDKFTIYLVQARPLIARTFTQKPSYIADEFIAKFTDEDIVRGESIGTAGGFVRAIQNMNELLIKDDLPQALNAYHDDSERARIKAVIVTRMAPATSHEATQFKGYAIPVLVFSPENRKKIEQLVAKGGVLIDTQRAVMILNTIDKQSAIEQGWYTHPIPMVTSVSSQTYMLGEPIKQKYPVLVRQFAWKKGEQDDSGQSMRDLVTMIKKSAGDKSVTLNALRRIIRRVFVLIEKKKQEEAIDADLLNEATRVLANLTMCAAEVLFTIDTLADSASSDRMAYLYPITFLEAVLFQQNNPEVISSYSYVFLARKLKEDIQAVVALGESEKAVGAKPFAYLVQLEKMKKLILAHNNQPLWQQFIKNLAMRAKTESGSTLELIQRFATVVGKLSELNVLDLWINSSFVKVARVNSDPISICKALINEIEGDENNKNLIAWMAENRPIIDSWNSKVEEWGNPNQFDTLYTKFEQEVVSTFISGADLQAKAAFSALMYSGGELAAYSETKLKDFAKEYAPIVSRFNAVNNLGKLLMIPFIKQIIDLYDRTIKGITGSSLYGDKQLLVLRFGEMLIPYVGLMEQLMVLIAKHEEMFFTSWKKRWNFTTYSTLIRDVLRKAPNQNVTYQASPGFSVGASQIGSKADYNRVLPVTMEDIFTVAHQNMLVILARLNSDYGVQQADLPLLIQNFYLELIKIKPFKDSSPANLVGIDYNYPNLVVYFNLPLRQHSATFELAYNTNEPNRAILTSKFYGQNEGNRMVGIIYYIYLASQVSHIKLASEPEVTMIENVVNPSLTTKFSWVITNKTSLDEVGKYLSLLAELTMNFADYPLFAFEKVNDIKPFLSSESISTIKGLTWNKQVPVQELQNFIQNLFAKVDENLFTQVMDFNPKLIQICIQAGLYERALKLIRYTIDYIVEKNGYDLPSKMTMNASLWQDCIDFLEQLIKNSSVPEAIRSQAQDQLALFLNEVTITKMLAIDTSKNNNDQLVSLIKTLKNLATIKQDEHMLQLVNKILNNDRFKKFKAFHRQHTWEMKLGPRKLIEALEDIQKKLTQKFSAGDSAS